jgi:hypothetical protein
LCDITINDILEAIAKIPGVKIREIVVPSRIKTKSTMIYDLELYKLANEIKASINPYATIMTMEIL